MHELLGRSRGLSRTSRRPPRRRACIAGGFVGTLPEAAAGASATRPTRRGSPTATSTACSGPAAASTSAAASTRSAPSTGSGVPLDPTTGGRAATLPEGQRPGVRRRARRRRRLVHRRRLHPRRRPVPPQRRPDPGRRHRRGLEPQHGPRRAGHRAGRRGRRRQRGVDRRRLHRRQQRRPRPWPPGASPPPTSSAARPSGDFRAPAPVRCSPWPCRPTGRGCWPAVTSPFRRGRSIAPRRPRSADRCRSTPPSIPGPTAPSGRWSAPPDGRLFVGGDFTHIAGRAQPRLGRADVRPAPPIPPGRPTPTGGSTPWRCRPTVPVSTSAATSRRAGGVARTPAGGAVHRRGRRGRPGLGSRCDRTARRRRGPGRSPCRPTATASTPAAGRTTAAPT